MKNRTTREEITTGWGIQDRAADAKFNRARKNVLGAGKEDGVLRMTYADGSVAKIKVPASAICKHNEIRTLCNVCTPEKP